MVYLFGDCRLDTESRVLERLDEPVHLAPKAFELLRLLLEARPRVLSKAELMERLWPETFVTDANLPVLVGEVRAAIGDEPKAARLVKTHHTVGYSFAGDVRELRATAALAQDLSAAVLRIGDRRATLQIGASLIGRDVDVEIRVNDLSVSKRHAKVDVSHAGAYIQDLESKNGTFVNGERVVSRTPLTNGSVVRLGSVEAVFVVEDVEKTSTVTLDSSR